MRRRDPFSVKMRAKVNYFHFSGHSHERKAEIVRQAMQKKAVCQN